MFVSRRGVGVAWYCSLRYCTAALMRGTGWDGVEWDGIGVEQQRNDEMGKGDEPAGEVHGGLD